MQSFRQPPAESALRNAPVPALVQKRPAFNDGADDKARVDAFSIPPSTFLPNTPCAFAEGALSSTLAESIDTPSATRRFRV